MVEILWAPLLFQVVIPLGLLLWLAVVRPSSYVTWALTTLLVGLYIRLIAIAGLWLALPAVLVNCYAVAAIVGAVISLTRAGSNQVLPRRRAAVAGAVLRAATALSIAALIVYANAARRPPTQPIVDLAFPLGNRTYSVVNGGGVELLNAHLATLTMQRARAYRGQSYGVDLVRGNILGFRASGILPSAPAAYAIFGDTVLAPCAGSVVAAEGSHRDMNPPNPDRQHMAGNHVLLACQDVWVLLAHLQRGTVRVAVGEAVQIGDPLGLVGNSGNTAEPHLHVHAQRPGTPDAPLGGEPLSIRLDGRYVVRNDRIAGAVRSPESP